MTQTAPALVIRPLLAADKPRWQPMWEAYLAFYATTLPQEVIDTTFARMIDAGQPDHGGFVAEAAGDLLGLTHYIYHRTGWAIAQTCYLQDLFTTPAARGQGVARALIGAVTAQAQGRGAPRTYWFTQEDNATARVLYDKLARLTGFCIYEVKR